MSRMVKDFVEIEDYSSLDSLIKQLVAVRDGLPEGAEPRMRLRDCDGFGRKLSISYFRPQTAEEAECDARYINAYRQSRERELSRLQKELGVVCPPQQANDRGLRIVA